MTIPIKTCCSALQDLDTIDKKYCGCCGLKEEPWCSHTVEHAKQQLKAYLDDERDIKENPTYQFGQIKIRFRPVGNNEVCVDIRGMKDSRYLSEEYRKGFPHCSMDPCPDRDLSGCDCYVIRASNGQWIRVPGEVYGESPVSWINGTRMHIEFAKLIVNEIGKCVDRLREINSRLYPSKITPVEEGYLIEALKSIAYAKAYARGLEYSIEHDRKTKVDSYDKGNVSNIIKGLSEAEKALETVIMREIPVNKGVKK